MYTYFQVNSFTREPTGGNPAGVVLLDAPISASEMQRIAGSHLLPETAFVTLGERPQVRWFTPLTEMDLCGHATLAAAHVLFEHRNWPAETVEFKYGGGSLEVRRAEDAYEMTFPARPAKLANVAGLADALGIKPVEVYKSRDVLALLEDEQAVHSLRPDFHALSEIDATGVIVTSAGKSSDFVSRYFAPRIGIDEDPCTGSAHCTLAPFWAEKLDKKVMNARQLSQRGGDMVCEVAGGKVIITGHAVTFIEGKIV